MTPEPEFLPPRNVVEALDAIQHEHGWLKPEALRAYSERTSTPLYKLHGVATFFPHYRTAPPPRCEVAVCRDSACWMAGGEALAARVRAAAASDPSIRVHEVSCLGRCDRAPAFAVNDVPCGAKEGKRIEEVLASPPKRASLPRGKAAYRCDPYAAGAESGAAGGESGAAGSESFAALRKVLAGGAAAEESSIAEMKESGLRGMGGAGFPTGMKWGFVRAAAGSPKFVVCNADESEPGTFKDREILARLPHLVIEGMLLGARAVGASRAVLYVRHEYGPEAKRFRDALRVARRTGAVGKNVLGSGWDCEVEVFVSPGGYICGEETALLEAMEGKRAEPRNKPPFPGTHGLHGKPTLINNVETFAFAPWIVLRGGAAWKSLGVRGGAGLKFVSVSGAVRKPRVVEVPMGTTVREIIDLCGGMPRGKRLKAFSPGGSSSNFLPASMADTPMDFKAMADAGSMLGSGALFVVAEGTPILPLALNVVRFFRNESCGKCVPCRVGSEKAVAILEDAAAGKPAPMDLVPELADAMAMTSICGLGQAALNPILSAMKHFPEECGTKGR